MFTRCKVRLVLTTLLCAAVMGCGNNKVQETHPKQVDAPPRPATIKAAEVSGMPVIAIPEDAFLKALEASEPAVPSVAARRGAKKVAAYANEPTRRALVLGEVTRGEASFEGEVFLVVKGEPQNITGFYVAAVRLSGSAPWQSTAPELLRGAAFQPLACCDLGPGEYSEICSGDDDSPLPDPCGPGGPIYRNVRNRAEFLSHAGGNGGVPLVDFGITCDISVASVRIQENELFCLMCQQVDCTETPADTGGGAGPGPGGSICSGTSVPDHCTMILDQEHVPPECGGLCVNCGASKDECFGPSGATCDPCLYVQDPAEGTCDSEETKKQKELLKTVAALVGCDGQGKGHGDGLTCCGMRCGCDANSQVCLQCQDDGSCSLAPNPTLVEAVKPKEGGGHEICTAGGDCVDAYECGHGTYCPVEETIKIDLNCKSRYLI